MDGLLRVCILLTVIVCGGILGAQFSSETVAVTRVAGKFSSHRHFGLRPIPGFIYLSVLKQLGINKESAPLPENHSLAVGTPWQRNRFRRLGKTCIFAHSPQKKGAKKWNRYRPKKSRPSDINRRPCVGHSSPEEYFNAPPEYLSVPDPEGCALLQQRPLQQVLEYLRELPLQYQRATSFFLPGPIQCSVSPPRIVASKACAIAAATAATSPDDAAAAAAEAAPLEKEKSAAYAKALRTEAEAAATTARDRADAFHPQPIVAAASAPQTRAARKLQEMASDPAVLVAVQKLLKLAQETKDDALQKLGEHMRVALLPVVLPTAEDFITGTGGATGPSAAEIAGLKDSALSNPFSSLSETSEKTALTAAKAAAALPPKELRPRIARREGLNPILRAVKLSPLSRFNPLLLMESVDRAWQAMQAKRFNTIVKKLLDRAKTLARRLEASGVPAASILDAGALEMYDAFRSLPRTNFVEMYRFLHSKPWETSLEREIADLRSKIENSDGEVSPKLFVDLHNARRRLRWLAFKRLQELGLVTKHNELDIMGLRSLQEALVQQREPLSFEERQRILLQRRLRPRYRILRFLDRISIQARVSAASVRLPVLGTRRDRRASATAAFEARRAGLPADGDALATPSVIHIGGKKWCGPDVTPRVEDGKPADETTAQTRVNEPAKSSQDSDAPVGYEPDSSPRVSEAQPHIMGKLSSKQLRKHSALLNLAAEATGVFDVLSRADYPSYQPVQDPFKLEEYLEAEYRRHSLMSAIREKLAKWLREGMPTKKKPVDSSKSFIAQWFSLSKKRRRSLLMEEMRLQAQRRLSEKTPPLRRRRNRQATATSALMAMRAKYNAGLLDISSHQRKRKV